MSKWRHTSGEGWKRLGKVRGWRGQSNRSGEGGAEGWSRDNDSGLVNERGITKVGCLYFHLSHSRHSYRCPRGLQSSAPQTAHSLHCPGSRCWGPPSHRDYCRGGRGQGSASGREGWRGWRIPPCEQRMHGLFRQHETSIIKCPLLSKYCLAC